MIRWWPEVEGDELCSSNYLHLWFKSARYYAESLELITFVVFLFWVIKHGESALSEEMGKHRPTVNRSLRLQGSSKEVYEDMKAPRGEGPASYSGEAVGH